MLAEILLAQEVILRKLVITLSRFILIQLAVLNLGALRLQARQVTLLLGRNQCALLQVEGLELILQILAII